MSRPLRKFQFDVTIGLITALLLFTLLVKGNTIDVHALRLGLSFVAGLVFAFICFVTDRSRRRGNL